MKEFINKLIGRLEERRLLHAELAQSEKLTDEEQMIQVRFCGCFSKAKAIVNELAEEYKGGWIACSERLPKEPMFCEDVYIIQASDVVSPYSAYWNGEYWTDELDEIIENVIAWQPLPQPYKENENGKV